ncbi:hypothetical protein Q9L58_004637 [Maublancomyces gigas]|uniref:H-type lectin domain-containing protein n=1 Tax=Discina gigas TaxID=1032678 RepID=A0ABR3GKT4_9PEZI
MNDLPPDPNVIPPYRPAPYLVSGPGAFLTHEELMLAFEDFHASLQFVNIAPQMVFERLIGNLRVPVNAAIERARLSSARDSGARKTCLAIPAPAIPAPTALPPAILAPAILHAITVDEEVHQTPLQVIRSFSAEDGGDASAFPCTKTFSTAGEAFLSRFTIGLTSFKIRNSARLIISARITTPEDNGISVTLSNTEAGGYCTDLKSVSCSLLELSEWAVDMQCGASPGLSVVSGLHLAPFVGRSLRVWVDEITSCSYTLRVYSQATSTIQDVEISWLAYSDERPDLTIGGFEGNWVPGQMSCEGYLAFKRGCFNAPPRVVVGMTGFKTDESRDLYLSVEVVQVTREGMKWRFDGGQERNIKSATGSFIAFE